MPDSPCPAEELFTEEDRLLALESLQLLDTEEEYEYDQLVHLASQICSTPVSLVSLVDRHRQWFKAAFGLAVRETPRSVSFCSHAIRQDGMFVVEDATRDPRFQDNALVTGDPSIRFYAGIPIHAPSGAPIGTLCVIDMQPRTLSDDQRHALAILGQQVEARMDLRYKRAVLEQAYAENQRLTGILQAANSMFQTFMDNGPFMSYVKDPEGRFVFYNQSLAENFGIDKSAWIGKSSLDLLPSEVAAAQRSQDLEVAASGQVRRYAETTTTPEGETVNWETYKFPIRDPLGNCMLGAISLDITRTLAQQKALAEANVELSRLATTDPLTGLFNRRVFQSRIEIEFSSLRRSGRPLTLMILDVDNFKQRNDRHGHAAGDQALEFLGSVLKSSSRKEDLAVRLGGEEFAILLPGTSTVSASVLAARIHAALRDNPAAPPGLAVSIGIASFHPSMAAWEDLFARADEALYTAKRDGKDRTVIHAFQ